MISELIAEFFAELISEMALPSFHTLVRMTISKKSLGLLLVHGSDKVSTCVQSVASPTLVRGKPD